MHTKLVFLYLLVPSNTNANTNSNTICLSLIYVHLKAWTEQYSVVGCRQFKYTCMENLIWMMDQVTIFNMFHQIWTIFRPKIICQMLTILLVVWMIITVQPIISISRGADIMYQLYHFAALIVLIYGMSSLILNYRRGISTLAICSLFNSCVVVGYSMLVLNVSFTPGEGCDKQCILIALLVVKVMAASGIITSVFETN